MKRSPRVSDEASYRAQSNLQAIFENTKDAIWSVDRERQFVVFNAALYTSILRQTGREVKPGDCHIDMECGEEAEFWKGVYNRAFAGERFTIERTYHVPGLPEIVEFSMSPINESGEITGVTGIARNVTRLHQVTSALRHSEEAYRVMFESSPLPMWVVDLESMKFLQVNRAAAKLYGYSETDFLKLSLSELEVEDAGEEEVEPFDRTDREDHHSFFRHITRSGDIIDVELFSHYHLMEGRPTRLMLVNDITEQLRSERAVVSSNERFRLAAEAVTSIIWDWNILDDRMERFGMMKKVLGYDPVTEGVHTYGWWLEQVHEKDREALDQTLKLALSNKPYFEAEYRVRHKDGHYVYVWDRGTIVRNAEGEPIRAVGNTLDITERKRMISEIERERERAIIAKQHAEEMNRLKSNFLANMSHEIRTPMTAILGFAEILAERIKDPEHAHYASTIEANGKRLLETINQILNLAKIEAGRLEVHPSTLDIGQAVDQTVELLQTLAAKKGLQLVVAPSESNILAKVDERYFNEILTNLIGNAIKFTDAGDVRISMWECSSKRDEAPIVPPFHRVKQGKSSFPCFAIEIADSGVGISGEFLPHIFDEFKQESTGYERFFEGTGIGLTITAKLIETMGGSIEVISAPSQGSKFIVRLPMECTNASGKPNQDAPSCNIPRNVNKNGHKRHILLVEDSAENAEMIDIFLRGTATVTHALNAGEALATIIRHPFDLVLMDVHLGSGLTGLDLTRYLRQQPQYEKLPIIALTAYAMESDSKAALQAGCNNYLSKPFDRAKLHEVIEDTLCEALVVA